MSILLGSQILICDDSNLERLYAAQSLANAGFLRLHLAKNWNEAIEICQNYSIDCCIIDLLMSEGEGTKLIKELRKLPNYQHVPMIIITASESEEKSWSCLEGGADDFVTKPYPEKTLAIRVKMHIERYIAESRYRNLIENMSNGVAVFSPVGAGDDFVFQDFNKAGESIITKKREDVIGRKFTEVFEGTADIVLLDVLKLVSQSGKPRKYTIDKYEEDLLVSWCEYYAYRLPNEDVVVVCDNLTDRMLANEELKRVNQRLKLAAEGARLGVWELNLSNYTFIWDDGVYKIFGITPDEFDLTFSSWEKMVHPEDVKFIHKRLLEVISGEEEYDIEFRIFKPSKEMRYVKCHGIVSYTDDGFAESLTGIIYDITEQKIAENKLEESAVKDELTGLYNRRYLYDRLNILLDKHLRDKSIFSVAIFDLDYFKSINDNYGHLAGDVVLRHFAELLKTSVRSYDVVARLGGEEFVVIFVNADKADSARFCSRILDKLANMSVNSAGIEIWYSFTCGLSDVSDCNQISGGIDRMVSIADKLLYKGKNNGRNQVVCN